MDNIGLLAWTSRAIGTQPRDLILTVTPPPRITNALPYLWVYADLLALGQQAELIPGAMPSLTGMNWVSYAAQRQPAIIVARPDNALAIRPHLAPEGRLEAERVALAAPTHLRPRPRTARLQIVLVQR